MDRKTVVLAESSYTIRRIIELSLSDETDIQLVSFDNGSTLKEKLLELRPQIVLADVKFPVFDGYDICKFIQETDALNRTKVILLKSEFERLEESRLIGLKFASIITKPFDANALVAHIKSLLEMIPA